MSAPAEPLADVRRRFSHADAAGKWDRLYKAETVLPDEANFRARRDIAVARVLGLVTPESTVLDLGCGAGPVLAELRRHGVNVIGMDYSEDMLEHARRRLQALALDTSGLFQGDCRSTPFPDASFDVVMCLGVISYLENYDPVLDEIERILKPRGTALISFRNVFNPVFSDPVLLGRRAFRRWLKPLPGPRAPEAFRIGRLLDFRVVTEKLEARGLQYIDFFGIGFGPFRLAGKKLFSDAGSIRISRFLARTFALLSIRRPLRWLTDVSLWVYGKPGP